MFHRLLRASAALGLLVALSAQAGHAQNTTIFSDSFGAGASPLWGNELGGWQASGGVYAATAPNNMPPTYTSLPFTLTDFTLDVDINRLQDGGIWLRSPSNPYGVLLVTGGRNRTGTGLYWHILRNATDYQNPPAYNEVTGLFTPGVSNAHLHITVTGNTYAVYVNGSVTPATTLTTDAFAYGQVALYDFSAQTFDNVVLTVPTSGATIAGKLTFEGIVPTAPAPVTTFVFRPTDGSGNVTYVASVPPSGVFAIPNVPKNNYTLHVKGATYLAANAGVNATGGDVAGVTAFLPAGDADGNNSVDIADFGVDRKSVV